MTFRSYSNVRFTVWWIGVSFWLLGIFAAQLVSAQEKKTFVAFSMKVAQERVEEAVRKGQDFRTQQTELFYLGGITKPSAVVIDSASGDWILLGERDPKSSVLTLDDWVVALKARFIHSNEDPGVTIDPIPSDTCQKEGKKKEACRDTTRQKVRFFGGIQDTHFGQVCYEADWLMKRMALALEQVPVQGLETYYDLAVKQARQAGTTNTSVASRFWFYPIADRVNVIGDVVLFEKMQMGVFTEVLYAEVDGQPVKDVDTFGHHPSEGFSRSFSEHYDALAQAREVLETLRGLTRLAALAKGLTQVEHRSPVTYYLQDYQAKQLSTPQEVEVLRRSEPGVGFGIAGGARLMALVTRLQGGDTSALQELVVSARPASRALSWTFELETQEGQILRVRLPAESGDSSQIGPLFAHARFLQEKKYVEAAIEAYTKVLQLNPKLVEGYSNRGTVYAKQGQYEQALADYTKALEIDPHSAQAQFNLGLMYDAGYGVPQNYTEALKWYRLAAAQGDATAQYNLGVMYEKGRGVPQDYTEALKWYRLAAAQGDATAQSNLGAMYEKGYGVSQDDAEAVKWFRLAAAQGLAIAQSNLGNMYANGQGVPQDYTEAMQWWRLAAAQDHAMAQYNLGVTYVKGQGVPQDYTEAMQWWRLAAAQGLAVAQYNLGVMYEKGRGVPQDYVQARKWFTLAGAHDEKARATADIVAAKLTPKLAPVLKIRVLKQDWYGIVAGTKVKRFDDSVATVRSDVVGVKLSLEIRNTSSSPAHLIGTPYIGNGKWVVFKKLHMPSQGFSRSDFPDDGIGFSGGETKILQFESSMKGFEEVKAAGDLFVMHGNYDDWRERLSPLPVPDVVYKEK